MKSAGSVLVVLVYLFVSAYSQDHYHYDNPPLVAGSFIDTVYTGTLSSDQVCAHPNKNSS